MRSRTLFICLALAALLAASLACNAPENIPDRPVSIDDLLVSPMESDGKQPISLVVYYTTGTKTETIVCTSRSPSGFGVILGDIATEATKAPVEKSPSLAIPVGGPGDYSVKCVSNDSFNNAIFKILAPEQGVTITDGSNVEQPPAEPKPQEPDPQPPAQNPQPPAQGGGGSPACHWVVAGTWNVTQVNNYHPVFVITQAGNSLSGSATLPPEDVVRGGYTGATGSGVGSVFEDNFTFTVTWPPKKNDAANPPGMYTGTIGQNTISGSKGAWTATGPSQCVSP